MNNSGLAPSRYDSAAFGRRFRLCVRLEPDGVGVGPSLAALVFITGGRARSLEQSQS